MTRRIPPRRFLPLLTFLSLLSSVLYLATGSCRFPPGRYPLEALADPVASEGVVFRGTADLEQTGNASWNLSLGLLIDNGSPEGVLVDLSRAMIRADETRWLTCRTTPGTDPSTLRFRLKEFQVERLALDCLDIPRPNRSFQVRIPLSGAGTAGYVDLSFGGVTEPK